MKKGGKVMIEKWKNQIEFINKVAEELDTEVSENRFCHYTSLPVLFNILEGDECWISNVRFSNDSSEEQLLGDVRNIRDDYVMCFCDSDDQLSQWRGYCHNGGASIEFYFDQPLEFSILWKDYKKTTDYELCENIPIPVIYFPSKPTNTDILDFKAFVKGWNSEQKIELEDILPYVKNNAFCEERELRMVFSNINGKFDNCVRFRTLDNGVKVPYMVIRCGDTGKMMGKCGMNVAKIDDTYLQQKYDNNLPIWIEEGSDQKEVYKRVKEKVNKFLVGKNRTLRVFCKGHLPIMQIRVAPSDNQERIAEQIKRFCKSKYWLQDVEVLASEIPYVQSLT